jgi:hypothetical protein
LSLGHLVWRFFGKSSLVHSPISPILSQKLASRCNRPRLTTVAGYYARDVLEAVGGRVPEETLDNDLHNRLNNLKSLFSHVATTRRGLIKRPGRARVQRCGTRSRRISTNGPVSIHPRSSKLQQLYGVGILPMNFGSFERF